jgi:hypothetical protein
MIKEPFAKFLRVRQKMCMLYYSKILEDDRHTSIIKIFDDEIKTPDFSSWSMNCINLEHYDKKQINGYKDFSEAVHNWNFINPLQVKEVLMHFKIR